MLRQETAFAFNSQAVWSFATYLIDWLMPFLFGREDYGSILTCSIHITFYFGGQTIFSVCGLPLFILIPSYKLSYKHNTVLKTTEWSNSATYRERAFAVRSWSFPCSFGNGKLLSDHVVIFIFFVYIVNVSQGGFHVGRAPRVENRENYIIYYDDKPNVFWHVILITSLTSPHFVRGI